ncbi:hypothetical protein JW796_04080 [Candidatus Dojkabacteria bacterium]|nr:hypothetical protein [Candidatus Dojkabacteria bacterium]
MHRLLYNPKFQVIFTWVWFLVGAIVTILLIVVLTGTPLSRDAAGNLFNEKPYILSIVEIVSVGLVPLIYTFAEKTKLALLGFNSKGIKKSLFYSLMFVLVFSLFGYLKNGTIMSDTRESFSVGFPLNIFFLPLAVFAWGPLEVFFFFWLVEKTDKIFYKANNHYIGLIITTILFIVTHILTTDLFNSLYTGFIFAILGVIYKKSSNIYGPMLAWTLVNGQIWYMIRSLTGNI